MKSKPKVHMLTADSREIMSYKYNIIFNSAEQSRKNSSGDTRLATAFANKLEDEMKHRGYKGYNPDKHAVLGKSVIKEANNQSCQLDCEVLPITSMIKEHTRMVKETDFTVIIVTPEFFNDYWSDYKNEAAFNFLTRQGERHRLIPIGLHTRELRELDVNWPLFFPDENSWQDDGKWQRLKQKFDGQEHLDEPHVTQPIQDNGDNIQRTDRQNIMTRPVSAASSLASFDESIDTSVGSQGITVASNEALNPDVVLGDGLPIPEPPIPSMESLNITGEVLYTREPHNDDHSTGVSMDGPRSDDTSLNRSMSTNMRSERPMDGHQTNEATNVAGTFTSDSNVHRGLPDGEEISGILVLDNAPTFSPSSLPGYNSSQTPLLIACASGNVHTASNVVSGLLDERGASTNNTDELNDDDLDVDHAPHLFYDLQSSTMASQRPIHDNAIQTMLPNNSISEANITQTPEHTSNAQYASDTYVMKPKGETSGGDVKSTVAQRSDNNEKATIPDDYCDTAKDKPEETEGSNATNIVHRGVNMLMNFWRLWE